MQSVNAQYKTVLFDETELQFNQGEPLPADQYFIINGYANPNVELVRFYIQKTGFNRNATDPILFENSWKRSKNNKALIFELPVNYALKGNVKYDFFFEHYTMLDSLKCTNLKDTISLQLTEYINKFLPENKNKLKLKKPYKEFLEGLRNIVKNGTGELHNKVEFNFAGFSTELNDKLKKIGRSGNSKDPVKKREQIIELINRDVERFVNDDLMVLYDEYKLVRYPIEKTSNILSVNLGFGGTKTQEFNRFADSSSPFIGLSIPFSSRQYSNAFVKNSAVSFGIALQNYTNAEGNTVTGPIIKRPIYFALGYKIFRVIRINAGMHLLSVEEDGIAEPVENPQIAPFFGLSAELDVWVGVGKRKKIRKR